MIASGDECGARRRAQRSGMELRVAQARLGNAIHRWRWDDATKGARDTVALVIRHDEQDVRRLLARHDAWRPPGFRLESIVLDHTAEFRIGRRKLLAADGGCRAWRTGRAGGLDFSGLR